MGTSSLDHLSINTIRTLSIDAVEAAGCGHPGAPMGLAPIGTVLWREFLKHNPKNPRWFNRDRFVLSAGHASMLLYSLLHLSGYDLHIEDLKNFRQLESRTAGHPEYGLTPGVETTTGPLGQGFANSVGMAMAESFLAATFNRPDFPVICHHTYAIVSDGDMMEGVASEAASLAGHLQLGKLICFYDDNNVTIDGATSLSMTEDVGKRFEAYGWHVQTIHDGDHDLERMRCAIKQAQEEHRPSFIILKTTIGYGSPNKGGCSASHGAALGPDEAAAAKEKLGWPETPLFYVPEDVRAYWRDVVRQGEDTEKDWQELLVGYTQRYPKEAAELSAWIAGTLPKNWWACLPCFDCGKSMATRSASGSVINALSSVLPQLVGGSADLAGSNNTDQKGVPFFSKGQRDGRNIHFGIREHAMAATMNGMALHGGVIVYGATFLIFSDYMRPAIRLASLMALPTIYIFTHDSIGLGEDGPTHQPVEQLASLRAIPGLTVIRPTDANEVSVAWQVALESTDGPTAIVLTRQNLSVLDRTRYAHPDGLKCGAYVIKKEVRDTIDAILLGSGSEVELLLKAAETLEAEGASIRVVGFPSWELFEKQSSDYKESILPPSIKARLAVEAGSLMGWRSYVGDHGDILAMTSFGASAPGKELFQKFGFTVENVVARMRKILN